MPAADDARARGLAAEIERQFPLWVVLWGVYSQEYWAFACFDVPQGIVVHSADPSELVRQMRQIELSFAARHGVIRRATGP